MTPEGEVAIDAIIAELEKPQVANCFPSVHDTHYATMPLSDVAAYVSLEPPQRLGISQWRWFGRAHARLQCWLKNLPTEPQRWAAAWLKRKGWVVFYLEDRSRDCNGGTCWMELYNYTERSPQLPRCNTGVLGRSSAWREQRHGDCTI